MLMMKFSEPGGGGGGRGGGGGGGGRGGGGGGGGFGPRRGGGGHHHHHHGGGGGFRRWRGGGGWWPAYNYGPEIVVVPPANNCQFTIKMPTGEQIIVTGACPVALTGPVQAMIAPL